jgi:hypothetical protein
MMSSRADGMATPEGWTRTSNRRGRNALFVAVVIVMILFAIILVMRHLAFSRKNVTESLLETFPGELRFERFEGKYFPHPGCRMEGLTFRLKGSASSAPPLVTIQKFVIRGSYLDLLVHPHYISRIVLQGLHIQVPLSNDVGNFSSSQTPSRITVGEVVANGAVLDVARHDNRPPVKFDFHELKLSSVSEKGGMSYEIAMRNPEPPGEVQASGHLGPFVHGNFGQTPANGKYEFDRADLSVFHGIAGALSSRGAFSGPLASLNVGGDINIPDFEVVRSEHKGGLSTHFLAHVDATNGDVILNKVDATYGETKIEVSGTVAHKDGIRGKFTSLDFDVRNGRIENVLVIFVKGHHHPSPMTGTATLHAHATVSPEGKSFLKELTIDGEFDIHHGYFKPKTQASVDTLSERARGEKNAGQNDDHALNATLGARSVQEKGAEMGDPPNAVPSELQSKVELRGGTATFTDLSFTVPGANARMHGTYNLLNQQIDFHGNVKIEANVSQTTTGIESVFATVLNPFFKKKHGSVVPVKMDGTYAKPHFGLDLFKK